MDKLQSIELYKYIFEYLEKSEYLNFIIATKEFEDMKRETITYDLIATEKKPLDHCKFWKIIQRVKNPKKQISLVISGSEKDLGLIDLISPYLSKLLIRTNDRRFTNEFNFSIFNNIPDVTLQGFKGVTKISSGLQNIQHLQLYLDDLVEIGNLNESGTLREIHFHKSLYFPPQKENTEIESLIRRGACSAISFNILGCNHLEMTQLFTHHLECLSLELDFKLTSSQINELIRVKDLSIKFVGWEEMKDDEDDQHPLHPGFSTFYGYNLRLTYFDLSLWEGKCFSPNLKRLGLSACKMPVNLPLFPKVTYIDFENLNYLKVIPTLPVLCDLNVTFLIELAYIDYQPKLTSLMLLCCPGIDDLQVLPGQVIKSISINDCEYISNDRGIFNSSYLTISNCPQVLLVNLNTIPYTRLLRSWSFMRQRNLEKLERLTNFNQLHLDTLAETDFDKLHISNINSLAIANCPDLQNTKNISLIKQSLVIEYCSNLTSLDKLQHIPKIALCSLPKVNNIGGLGHHEHLYIYRVPFLAMLARRYAESKAEGREESHPFHEIFGTIKACTILKKSRTEEDSYVNQWNDSDRFVWFRIDKYQEKLW